MRHAVLAIVMAALFGALAANAAAAEPAFFECAKLKGGAFADKLCSESAASKGKFELQEGISGKKKTFSAKAADIQLEGESLELLCLHVRMAGEVTAPSAVGHVTITMESCTTGAGLYCGAAVGHHRGVIELGPLSGTLGYIDAATRQVGLDLAPESGRVLGQFGCNAGDTPEDQLVGSLLGALSGDVDAVGKSFALGETGSGSFEGDEPQRLEALPIGSSEAEPLTVHAGTLKGTTGGDWEVKA